MALAFPSCAHGASPKSKNSYWIEQERRKEIAELKTVSLNTRTSIIPSPEIFSALKYPTAVSDSFPATAECAVHLELLEVFLALKQKVLTSNALDRAFSIVPNDKLVTVGRKRTREADATFQTRRAVKWPIYVRLAAARFLKWWDRLDVIMSGGHPEFWDATAEMRVTENWLPPVDVLMVWHALLLNPAKYKVFCETGRWRTVYSLDFPWMLIHQALSNAHQNFELGPNAAAVFERYVGEVDLFQSLANHTSQSTATKQAFANVVTSSGKSLSNVSFSSLQGGPMTTNEWMVVDELGSAVERQGLFVEKMGNSLWLRSPALEGTLDRALVRYEHFMKLFKNNMGIILVPTLDIDLIWHTHQCSANSYQMFCGKEVGRSINHDDSLGKETLKNSFRETCLLYETQFKDEYNVCLCWICEALKSELERSHLGTAVDLDVISKKVKDDVKYYKAFELNRRSETVAEAKE
ncbi:hypothetical protein B0O99DRAFT_690461 [Bisporella sp. PMI_857]|nr:hypothetical protein B0O99DRAFT_690461 [Bisporella sp. PMI_857]